MKFLILIYTNPESRQIWENLPADQRSAGLRAYQELTDELTASGELIVSGPLADPSHARRVTVRDGQPLTTDGPFAEIKEYLAGFYYVECDSAERAIEHAARVPGLDAGVRVEVWPMRTLNDFGVDM
ncbi:MAG TPA: YciI family protein [Jatrophihabitantaceae bacterium]